MTARTRLWVLVVSTPVIAFTLVGGYLGQAMTRDETLRSLRVFEDVMQLVVDNYVEDVDVRKAMRGAMRGLTDGLDLPLSLKVAFDDTLLTWEKSLAGMPTTG